MTADDCYSLRNCFLHEGVIKGVINKYFFNANDFHLVKIDDVIQVNTTKFCEDVIRAAEQWNNYIKNNQSAQEQLNRLAAILSREFTFYPPDVIQMSL